MTYRFEDREVASVPQLFEYIKLDYALLSSESGEAPGREAVVWYRGVPAITLPLTPTLHRDNIPVSDEGHLLNRFKQNAYEFLQERPQGEWEWMLLARHHGLPSRLLDWTENILAGLFFAANGYSPKYSTKNGVLWCLAPTELNSVALTQTSGADVVPMFSDESGLSSDDDFLSNYKTSRVSTLMSFGPTAPAAAMSIRANKRIQAQWGVFTIHHADRTPLEQWGSNSYLWRYVIPRGKKASIRKELRLAGVTMLTLFPDLDNAAGEARRGY